MSDVYEEKLYDEAYEESEEFHNDELLAIQQEYRRKRLIESLIGPVVSTAFHVVMIIVLAIIITDKISVKKATVEVELMEEEEVVIEEPEDVPEPEEIIEETDVSQRKTKIICTLGPACSTEEKVIEMLDAGMDVARLNFSHGDHKVSKFIF